MVGWGSITDGIKKPLVKWKLFACFSRKNADSLPLYEGGYAFCIVFVLLEPLLHSNRLTSPPFTREGEGAMNIKQNTRGKSQGMRWRECWISDGTSHLLAGEGGKWLRHWWLVTQNMEIIQWHGIINITSNVAICLRKWRRNLVATLGRYLLWVTSWEMMRKW